MLKVDKTSYKKSIYYIGYVTLKNIGDYESIHRVNPVYLIIGDVDGYIEENNWNKYLPFASIDKNKEVFIEYTKRWNEIKYLIKTINSGEAGDYEKGFMKIKFELDNNLPLDKTIKLHMLTVIVKFVSEEYWKYCEYVFLDQCSYEL